MKTPLALVLAFFAGLATLKLSEVVTSILAALGSKLVRMPPDAVYEFLLPFVYLVAVAFFYHLWRKSR